VELSEDLCILTVAEVALEKLYTIVAFGLFQVEVPVLPPVDPVIDETDGDGAGAFVVAEVRVVQELALEPVLSAFAARTQK
jgi:hypothetical protein